MAETKPHPVSINLRRRSRILAIAFDDGAEFELGFELLRVYSPSAEVRGHGPAQEVLQAGKEDVDVVDIQPVGNYAVRLVFDDVHDSGIYGWDYLYDLGRRRDWYCQRYLELLRAAGIRRKV